MSSDLVVHVIQIIYLIAVAWQHTKLFYKKTETVNPMNTIKMFQAICVQFWESQHVPE